MASKPELLSPQDAGQVVECKPNRSESLLPSEEDRCDPVRNIRIVVLLTRRTMQLEFLVQASSENESGESRVCSAEDAQTGSDVAYNF
jgi:hypothetical protein